MEDGTLKFASPGTCKLYESTQSAGGTTAHPFVFGSPTQAQDAPWTLSGGDHRTHKLKEFTGVDSHVK